MRKRIFSLLLALCLVAGMLPTVAYADGGTSISVTVKNYTHGTAAVEVIEEWYEGANRFSVISKLPCVVIVEHSNGTDDLLECGEIDATTGHYRFFINAADGDTISIAVKGDVNLDGIVTNIVQEAVYDKDGNYWVSYTSYKLNADGTRTSERLANGDLYNSGDFDVAKLSAYISDPERNALNTLQQYAADIDYDGQVTQSDVDFLKNYISGSESSVSWDVQYNCYTITFDTGDGGSTVSEQKVLEGELATEPTAPTKKGCTFVGWYKGDTLYDFSIPVTENITLTAKWSFSRIMLTKDILESTYKVIYGLGDYYELPDGHYYLGENISLDKKIEIGDRNTVNNVILDLNGYELRKDTDGALLFLQNDSTLTVMDSSGSKTGKIVSNYAIGFNKRGKLNANGGTIEGDVHLTGDNAIIDNTDPSNVTVFRNRTIYGESSTAIINGGIFYSMVNSHEGQIIGGTFYGEVTNTDTITGGTFYGEVTNTNTITGGTFYGTVSGSGTIEDSAKVTVTFDSDGGSPMTEQKVLRGQKATEPTAPTKADCIFEGWYNGDALYNFNTPVTENIALTAKWSEKPGIIFNTNPQSYSYDGSVQAFSITGTAVTGFDISYKKSSQTVTNPTDVGSYDVIIKRAEDNTYKTVNETITNGLVINPATPTESLVKKTTARVGRGRTLADATVTNGEILALDGVTPLTGTFAWVDSTKAMSEDGTEQMVFTPDDTNYAPITIDVAVSTYTRSTPTYSPAVVQPEIGGTIEVSPANPKKGSTVTITPKPDAGYKVEKVVVTANGVPIEVTLGEDGTYSFIQPAGKVTIELVYAEEQAAELPFKDVPKEAYYYDAVKWAAENGITGGTSETTFSPEDPCTRAQIVTFLWIAADCPEPASLAGLLDVSADAYYAKAVAWALEQGITSGTGDGKFNPDAVCSRAQAMTFIYLNEVAKGGGMKGAWMFLNPFTDVEPGSYYGEAVMWALANGITSGTSDTTFSPDAFCTRAQIVTFLYGALAGK